MSQNLKIEHKQNPTFECITFIIMEIDCAQHWGNHSFGSSLNKNKIVRMNSHFQKNIGTDG